MAADLSYMEVVMRKTMLRHGSVSVRELRVEKIWMHQAATTRYETVEEAHTVYEDTVRWYADMGYRPEKTDVDGVLTASARPPHIRAIVEDNVKHTVVGGSTPSWWSALAALHEHINGNDHREVGRAVVLMGSYRGHYYSIEEYVRRHYRQAFEHSLQIARSPHDVGWKLDAEVAEVVKAVFPWDEFVTELRRRGMLTIVEGMVRGDAVFHVWHGSP